jgi:tRNA-splicing ligase RtcB
MGRKDAERKLDLQTEIMKLDSQGILHGIRGKHDLDEAPGAYKDIDVVMNNQSDLVEIMVELSPLGVIKG